MGQERPDEPKTGIVYAQVNGETATHKLSVQIQGSVRLGKIGSDTLDEASAPESFPCGCTSMVNNFFQISICKQENFLNFPPPPYPSQRFSSLFWRRAEWLAKRMAIR
jgi:hypothetical protein